MLSLLHGRASADSVMRYIYDAPESARDARYAYQWEILETALRRTSARYGPFVMEPGPRMTEKRQADELLRATGKITVMYLDTTPEFERTLVPVRIPVDRSLVGYRVFLVRRADLPRFAAVRSLDDLRTFTFGVGRDWVDAGILRANGFRVVTGSSYDGLFEMLENSRFDVFSRGAGEVLDELDKREAESRVLALEPGLILAYPLPMYFWFSRTAEGERSAARVREGMISMIDDGTYDRIFMKHLGPAIERLHLRERRVFRIDNPNLGPETPFEDTRLWFRL